MSDLIVEINKKRNNQTKSQPKATSIKSSELNIVTQRQKQQAKGTTQKQEQAKFGMFFST